MIIFLSGLLGFFAGGLVVWYYMQRYINWLLDNPDEYQKLCWTINPYTKPDTTSYTWTTCHRCNGLGYKVIESTSGVTHRPLCEHCKGKGRISQQQSQHGSTHHGAHQ